MKKAVFALLALVASVALITTASAEQPKSKQAPSASTPGQLSEQLQEAVKVNGIFRHLDAFQAIADENESNRASGTPGYDESAKYVVRQLKNYGWNVEQESFDYDAFVQVAPTLFEQTAPTATTYVENTDFSTMEYSGSGDVTAEVVAIDLVLPPSPEPSSTSGCEPGDFEGTDVTGKVALMQRGSCDFAVKVQNAEAAGAAASIIFNEGQEGRTDVVFGTLGGEVGIPAIDTSFELGQTLAGGATNGPTGTTVRINTETRIETTTTTNVVAETPKGRGGNVVMAGAHLDSVPEGPGINDNGSGSATLVELARQISKTGFDPKNKIRFAWWGAEESGLIGSTEYVEGLSQGALGRIALYLNFDMIGSPNFARLIYDGDGSAFGIEGPAGSNRIERTFARHFEREDLASGETAFDGRSDYLAFIDAGIPSGGLFTGAEEIKTEDEQLLYGGQAGVAFDECYHQACDDYDNVSRRGLSQMAPAVADAVARYSISTESLGFGRKAQGAKRRSAASVQSDYLGNHLAR